MPDKECNHKWIHLSTHYQQSSAGYNTEYIRLDVFFCEKCCETKEVEKREYSRERPLWWAH